jgi:hypothetical protein
MGEKASLNLIEGNEALDLDALRQMYINLTGEEPTPEELAEAEVMLAQTKAKDAAKTKP